MSGNKCSYFNCKKPAKKGAGLRKFTFPVRDAARCKQWIINSGWLINESSLFGLTR